MIRVSLGTLGCVCAAVFWACDDPTPRLGEADIPVSGTVAFHFDESRMTISAEPALGSDTARLVEAVSRASTERLIAARATQVAPGPDGGIVGVLGLHRGWRQEFFALPRAQYERGHALAPGELLAWDINPAGITREVVDGSIIPGVSDNFTAIFTRVIDVPTAGSYSFRIDSDDGTIGTLQDLSEGLHEVRLLWYDWRNQPLRESVFLSEGHRLEPGRYLLTIHYYEEWHHAGYLIEMSRDPGAG